MAHAEWLSPWRVARLEWAAAAVRGNAAGAELRRTWASFKRLEAAGRGSSASRAFETRVLVALCVATDTDKGGLVGEEFKKVFERQADECIQGLYCQIELIRLKEDGTVCRLAAATPSQT